MVDCGIWFNWVFSIIKDLWSWFFVFYWGKYLVYDGWGEEDFLFYGDSKLRIWYYVVVVVVLCDVGFCLFDGSFGRIC